VPIVFPGAAFGGFDSPKYVRPTTWHRGSHTNGLLVRTAPLDGAAQVNVPTFMRSGIMMRDHYPSQAGHPGANKMYTSMRRWFY